MNNMRDLKELFIENIGGCPVYLEGFDTCNGDCNECWRNALKNIDIIERDA
jgi:hypothetical protein